HIAVQRTVLRPHRDDEGTVWPVRDSALVAVPRTNEVDDAELAAELLVLRARALLAAGLVRHCVEIDGKRDACPRRRQNHSHCNPSQSMHGFLLFRSLLQAGLGRLAMWQFHRSPNSSAHIHYEFLKK